MNNGEWLNKAPAFDAGAALAALRERGRRPRSTPCAFASSRRWPGARMRTAATRGACWTSGSRSCSRRMAMHCHCGDARAAAMPRPRRVRVRPAGKHRPSAARSPSWSSTSPGTRTGARRGPASGGGTPELKAVTYYRSTWSKLSAERRLTQSLAKVPDNAGPLNSHHLVHRALILMRDLSPEYLNRFMSYVDALLWIDQANGSMAAAAATAPRTENSKKTGRGKAA
jgi:hypothetical protein